MSSRVGRLIYPGGPRRNPPLGVKIYQPGEQAEQDAPEDATSRFWAGHRCLLALILVSVVEASASSRMAVLAISR